MGKGGSELAPVPTRVDPPAVGPISVRLSPLLYSLHVLEHDALRGLVLNPLSWLKYHVRRLDLAPGDDFQRLHRIACTGWPDLNNAPMLLLVI